MEKVWQSLYMCYATFGMCSTTFGDILLWPTKGQGVCDTSSAVRATSDGEYIVTVWHACLTVCSPAKGDFIFSSTCYWPQYKATDHNRSYFTDLLPATNKGSGYPDITSYLQGALCTGWCCHGDCCYGDVNGVTQSLPAMDRKMVFTILSSFLASHMEGDEIYCITGVLLCVVSITSIGQVHILVLWGAWWCTIKKASYIELKISLFKFSFPAFPISYYCSWFVIALVLLPIWLLPLRMGRTAVKTYL